MGRPEGIPYPDADDEVVRMLLRKRDRLWVGTDDPFEDWATEFSVDGVTYYLPRAYRSRSFFARQDRWSSRTYFRPAEHLLDTLRDVVRAARQRQDATGKAEMTRKILA